MGAKGSGFYMPRLYGIFADTDEISALLRVGDVAETVLEAEKQAKLVPCRDSVKVFGMIEVYV